MSDKEKEYSKILCDTTLPQQCGALIFLDGGDPHVNTYCMREKGHSGKHNIVNVDPEAVMTTTANTEEPKVLSKEEILEKKYGPFSKDDSRAKRGF